MNLTISGYFVLVALPLGSFLMRILFATPRRIAALPGPSMGLLYMSPHLSLGGFPSMGNHNPKVAAMALVPLAVLISDFNMVVHLSKSRPRVE